MSPTNRPMRAIMADDEPLARSYFKELLAAHPEVELVAECRNGLEAARAIAALRPDVAFLDIEMPRLDGFEVLELAEQPLAVVFVTAYDSYAVRAFEARAVDYLLKPFSAERLAAALERVRDRVGRHEPLDGAGLRREVFPDRPFVDRLAIKDGAEIAIIDTADIDYIRSEDDYASVHVKERSWLKHETMSGLERALDPRRFVRIHRTCIVNVARVARVEQETKERYSVSLKDRTELPASREGMKRLRDVLGL
ncbi:MAG: LytTR family DNA-binding domain-containing protein [Deltaproteobacteria bacterium]|nr:LytTR family DNA-binding domain-containing protein [Deltaproteobacteria bacterium]